MDHFLDMLYVGVCCAVVSVPCSLVVTCWDRLTSWLSCLLPKCVLFHNGVKSEVDAVKLV